MSDATDPQAPQGSASPPPAPATPPPPAPRRRGFAYRWGKRLVITALILVVVVGGLLAGAEYETSKPEFCGSCHIMEPYHDSWQADPHGSKLGVACVDCHYAPGEQNTVNSKLRGLSQVASYFSGRYGSGRPRAHVDNRSCLTSKCHGDMKFMDKELKLGTVKFFHAKHLQNDEAKQKAVERDLDELGKSLRQVVGPDRYVELEQAAQQAVPAKQRVDEMTRLVKGWNAPVDRTQLVQLSDRQHMQVRLAQLADLQCTNCHSYAAPMPSPGEGGAPARAPGKRNSPHHFTVKTTTCYTCHFHNEGFNTGTAKCLTCHALPTKEILAHPETNPADPKLPAPGKALIKMDHKMILERKVDCIACHADVAGADVKVSRRDCERCHDRPDFFKEWKQPFTLDLVKHYHSAHVPSQRAKCLDCHSEIQHQLIRGTTPEGQPEFLSSVMANCTSCHPSHHREQLELLSGVGGKGVPKGEANLMFGSRTNCFGCHTEQTTSDHHGVTVRAALSGCAACHGDKHNDTFKKWKLSLDLLLMEANEAFAKARQTVEKSKDVAPETRRKAAELIDAAGADLRLVKRGNGIHNVMYSIELLDSVTRRCQQATTMIEDSGRKP